ASLARFVIELEGNAWHTAAAQWLERTLDDSANRRLVIPEAFLASDAILVLATNVAAGLEVREAVIARHVAAQLPFLATERLLMRGVKAGGDRQRLHEVIRTHSLAIAQAMAEQGVANDLLERLAKDPAFRTLHVALGEPVPDKGAVLTQLSAFWFERLASVISSHFLSADADEIVARVPGLADHRPALTGRAMLVRRTTPVPFECVVRGYLSGSAWAEYQKAGTLAGEPLPAGLVESARLDPPIFSPATKAEVGHDENVTVARSEE